MGLYPHTFFLSLFQYGDLHFGQIVIFSFLGSHVQLHLLQVNLGNSTLIYYTYR